MFYIIEYKYTGPNRDENIDADTIEIDTRPALTNSSKEVRTVGWCGTTGDWCVYAHGAFTTIEQAREAIKQEFGDTRTQNDGGETFESDSQSAVEVHKKGKYSPMSASDTADWAYTSIQDVVTADTTDEEIQSLIAELAEEAQGFGCQPHQDSLLNDMEVRRQELQDEAEEE